MGTIFVNTFSNILCTCATNAFITIKPKNNVKIVDIIGYKNSERIMLGDIKFG